MSGLRCRHRSRCGGGPATPTRSIANSSAGSDVHASVWPTLELATRRDASCSVEEGVLAYRKLPNAELGLLPTPSISSNRRKIGATIEFLERHQDG